MTRKISFCVGPAGVYGFLEPGNWLGPRFAFLRGYEQERYPESQISLAW